MDSVQIAITLGGMIAVSILVSVVGFIIMIRDSRVISDNLKESQRWTQAYGAALLRKGDEAEKMLKQILANVNRET